MANQPLRFVHSSDFHLGRAMRGLAEVPDHLRDALIDASYTAAARVFDAVIHHQADFLLLAGDIFSAEESGPRGYAFLEKQFQRLQRLHIPVYWCGGRIESAGEQVAHVWPSNVTLFSADRAESVTLHKQGESAARILGAGYRAKRRLNARDFSMADDSLPNIAMAYGRVDAESLHEAPIGYWALGGEHKQQTVRAAREVAHYSGAPQGFSPASSSVHSCTVIDWSPGNPPRLSTVATDAVRWHHETLVLDQITPRDELSTRLRDRCRWLADHSTGVHLLVNWSLSGSAEILNPLRHATSELIDELRSEFGRLSPALWAVEMKVESREEYPAEWYEEETILGDFLRTMHDYSTQETEIALASLLSEKHRAGELAEVVELEPAHRERVLRQATTLGVELLRGEETKS